MKRKNLYNLLIVSVLIIGAMITLCSCAGIGMIIGGSTKTFDGKYSIELEKFRSDILEIIGEVGKSMSLTVSEFNAQAGRIMLSSGFSTGTALLIGKTENRTIAVTRKDSGKKLEVDIITIGNFGVGTKETADKLFNDFRDKLNAYIQAIPKEEEAKQIETPPTLAKDEIKSTEPPKITEPSNETKPSKLSLEVIKPGNVRSTPSTSSKIIAKVKKGEMLQGQGKSGDWYIITLPSGEGGWVFKGLVKVVD
jgi:hypothetical protein